MKCYATSFTDTVFVHAVLKSISVNLRLRRFPAVSLLAKSPRLSGWFAGEAVSENLRSLGYNKTAIKGRPRPIWWLFNPENRGGDAIRIKLRVMLCLPGPHGDEVAVLRSFRPINRAQEPRLRGGSSVAVALHATAGLTSNRFPAGCCLSLMRMGGDAPSQQEKRGRGLERTYGDLLIKIPERSYLRLGS